MGVFPNGGLGVAIFSKICVGQKTAPRASFGAIFGGNNAENHKEARNPIETFQKRSLKHYFGNRCCKETAPRAYFCVIIGGNEAENHKDAGNPIEIVQKKQKQEFRINKYQNQDVF